MLSLAAKHRVKVEAEQHVCTASPPTDTRLNHLYRVSLYQLKADHKRLQSIKSQTRRREVKREILTQYRDYLDGVLVAGITNSSGQDSVLVWCTLWAADVGDIPQALDLLKHGMTAPDGFSRSLADISTEEISKTVLAATPADYAAEMERLWQMVKERDMSDIITARLCKAYGLAIANTDPHQAHTLLQQAQTLHPHIGVKSHLKRLSAGKPVETTAITAKRYDMPTRAAALTVHPHIPKASVAQSERTP
ncbi:phage terminase small subunit [Thiothrix subterranea]|uniref:Phage terminase small subunit n=1 Tax=Thiothrix subterranea TaxID=2735563 RepID=A0AA51MJ87_9GAMM|nr:phage terminase small subunit [Thiothrix subterranea]MDQ5771006.1 phage terminase small subunit [Thiothrix subterranea]WML84973.1 phage terminase small subunit [Thiothrix subterranea]